MFEGTDQGPTPTSGIINHAHSGNLNNFLLLTQRNNVFQQCNIFNFPQDDDVEKPISNSDGILPSDNIQCDRDEIIVDTPGKYLLFNLIYLVSFYVYF